MSESILSGVRVVEFSAFVAAPLAGLTLAQLGADVIRVDPIGGNIDTTRLPLNAEGKSLYWGSLNCGKRSVELNVRSDAGKKLMRQLILAPGASPPIFLTNLSVNGELSYEAMSAERPDLIMVQLTGSPDGKNAVDYTVNCAVGFPSITGNGSYPVVNHVLPAWDICAGLTLATSILAADRHWRLTGLGQKISVALSDVAMAAVSNLGYLADAQVNGAERRPDGNFVYGAYGDDFMTSDERRIMVTAITNRQWSTLTRTMGIEQGLQAAAGSAGFRLDSEQGRYEAREFISAVLRPWFRSRTLKQIEALFDPKGILWSPYRTFGQMLAEDPRCSPSNPLFATLLHPGYGEYLTARSPIQFEQPLSSSHGVAPRLGQHTLAVLRSLPDIDQQAIHQFQESGVIAPGTDL